MKAIEGYPNLARTSNGVIINTNRSEIQQARLNRQKLSIESLEQKKLKEDVLELKSDIDDMKTMLMQIVERLK